MGIIKPRPTLPIMTRQDTPPARGALREKQLGKIERRSSVATLAKSGPKGSCELRLAGEQRTLTGELLCDDGVSDAFISSLAAALNG